MAFLKNLFGHKESVSPAVAEPVECPHGSLLARWDSVEDMGKEDRAAYYVCEACGAKFEPAQARKMQGEGGIEMFMRPGS